MIHDIPLPATDNPVDAPFWQYAAEGKLAVQICGDCGSSRFPPRPYCPDCQSSEQQWKISSGRGTVWSYVEPHGPLLPAFSEQLPYVVALVELEDYPGIRIVGAVAADAEGNIQGVKASQLNIGDPVQVVFQQVEDDVFLPRWSTQIN